MPTHEVEFVEGCFWFDHSPLRNFKVVVIGNIYENPDLLSTPPKDSKEKEK